MNKPFAMLLLVATPAFAQGNLKTTQQRAVAKSLNQSYRLGVRASGVVLEKWSTDQPTLHHFVALGRTGVVARGTVVQAGKQSLLNGIKLSQGTTGNDL